MGIKVKFNNDLFPDMQGDPRQVFSGDDERDRWEAFTHGEIARDKQEDLEIQAVKGQFDRGLLEKFVEEHNYN